MFLDGEELPGVDDDDHLAASMPKNEQARGRLRAWRIPST
jgi:hypothetical protein